MQSAASAAGCRHSSERTVCNVGLRLITNVLGPCERFRVDSADKRRSTSVAKPTAQPAAADVTTRFAHMHNFSQEDLCTLRPVIPQAFMYMISPWVGMGKQVSIR